MLDKKGTRVLEIEMKKKDGLSRDPVGVAVDDEDNMYVVEREDGCISKYMTGMENMSGPVLPEN